MSRELILIPKEKFEEMMKNCSKGKTIIEDDKIKPSTSEYSEDKTIYSSVKPGKWIQKSNENTTQTGDGNESYVKMTPKNFLTQKDKNTFRGIQKEKKQRKSTVNEKINWETSSIKEKDKNIKTKWLSFKI